jgi:curved DNA-binding protein CbpA
MEFFANCSTVEEAKSLYRALARKHHPDLGGDAETMKRLNNEYEQVLKKFDGKQSIGTDGKAHTYKYNEEIERELMQVISTLLVLEMEGVDITLIGLWVWVTGNTKPHKDSLKEVKCRWHSTRKCWYYRPAGLGYRPPSGANLEELAEKYGAVNCANFKKRPTQKRRSKALSA